IYKRGVRTVECRRLVCGQTDVTANVTRLERAVPRSNVEDGRAVLHFHEPHTWRFTGAGPTLEHCVIADRWNVNQRSGVRRNGHLEGELVIRQLLPRRQDRAIRRVMADGGVSQPTAWLRGDVERRVARVGRSDPADRGVHPLA